LHALLAAGGRAASSNALLSLFVCCAGCRWFKDKAGQLHDKHPVYDYYIGAMFMDQGGYAQLKALSKERPPTAEEV
jgi:hypothetical protein